MRLRYNAPQYRARVDGREEQRQMVQDILDNMRRKPSLKGPQTYVRYENGRYVEYVR